ncbi:MAG: L-threonylcarbamoyladenylate synthase [Acidimicrobiales bacterium]|jgi:L-threonylcarbamoyladenylate synthase
MIILYPTETLYALGVNALDEVALKNLFKLKGRDMDKPASWLVRRVEDIERYAELPEKAEKIAKQFLPGSLTLVLKVKDYLSDTVVAPDRTIGFRVSNDPMTEQIVDAFMEEYDSPLTCTSANVSGAPTFATPGEILQQFGEKAQMINEIHDDDSRKALASTVVRVVGDTVTVLREGSISEKEIMECVKENPS